MLTSLVLVWFIIAGLVDNKRLTVGFPNRGTGQHSATSGNSRNVCSEALPTPPWQMFSHCKPYVKGENGYCSNEIGHRHVYGSYSYQEEMEKNLVDFDLSTFNVTASDKCRRAARVIYCNEYFKECDNSTEKILPRPLCREACEAVVEQHCKDEWPKVRPIRNALLKTRSLKRNFHLINCSSLPSLDGGSTPECYYPKELYTVKTPRKEDLTESCFYGDGQSYRGNISVTRSGYTCQSWNSQCPHRHRRISNSYPELEHAGNACRNPGGLAPHGPWCYTTSHHKRWEYCKVPLCAPVDGRLSQWTSFTSCSASCGGGNKTRTRTCAPPRYGGKPCASSNVMEHRPCNTQLCSGHNTDGTAVASAILSNELTTLESAIICSGGAVLFILIAVLLFTFVIRYKNRPSGAIQESEEVMQHAPIHISTLWGQSTDPKHRSLLGMIDNPLKTMHFPRAPTAEKLLDMERRESFQSVQSPSEFVQQYENIDQQYWPVVTPLENLFFKTRCKNNEVETGMECDVVVIKPGYDKSKRSKSEQKRRETLALYGRAARGSVSSQDSHVYDTLLTEDILSHTERCTNDYDDESDDDRIIHTILEVPSADERSQSSSIDRTQNADRKPSQSSLDSQSKEAISIVENDFEFLDGMDTDEEEKPDKKLRYSTVSDDGLQMEEQTGLFEFFNKDTLRRQITESGSASCEAKL